jgi:hypothetical protein
MGCCPKPDKTPLDVDREGPSEEDLVRFGGEDGEALCAFPDEVGGAGVERGGSLMVRAAPVAVGVGIVALLLVLVL